MHIHISHTLAHTTPSQRCQFKCGSVGGMTYHFIRCAGNSPMFRCTHCPRSYESRTGLNYHMASSHCDEPLLLDEVYLPYSSPIDRAMAEYGRGSCSWQNYGRVYMTETANNKRATTECDPVRVDHKRVAEPGWTWQCSIYSWQG